MVNLIVRIKVMRFDFAICSTECFTNVFGQIGCSAPTIVENPSPIVTVVEGESSNAILWSVD